MNCDRCGQEVKECEYHWFIHLTAGDKLRCSACGHDFGPVRELIEKAGWWDETRGRVTRVESDLRAQVATLTRERDEARKLANASQVTLAFAKEKSGFLQLDLDAARARIAELEKVPQTFNEGVWDRAVRSTLERLRDQMTDAMNFLEKEVMP